MPSTSSVANFLPIVVGLFEKKNVSGLDIHITDDLFTVEAET